MIHKCEVCERDGDKITVIEQRDIGPEYLKFCSRLHALLHLLSKYSKEVKAASKTNSVRIYQTASAVLSKLSKAVEKEWKQTA